MRQMVQAVIKRFLQFEQGIPWFEFKGLDVCGHFLAISYRGILSFRGLKLETIYLKLETDWEQGTRNEKGANSNCAFATVATQVQERRERQLHTRASRSHLSRNSDITERGVSNQVGRKRNGYRIKRRKRESN
jgi:hypothetical protein